MSRELIQGNYQVSLVDDAFAYNDKFFTLEVTELQDGEGVDNDATHSGLPVTASDAEIDAFLAAAMDMVQKRCGPDYGLKNEAYAAALAGLAAAAQAHSAPASKKS